MRDPARIDRILGLIREVWTRYPDLRLCQLIGNVFPGEDNYFREDEDLERGLRSYERWTSKPVANDDEGP